MKITLNSLNRTCSSLMIPVLALLAAAGLGRANVVIGTFNSSADVSVYNFQGWNGSSGGVAAFSTNAPSGGLSSGSMQLQLMFDNPGQQGGSFVSSAAAVASPVRLRAKARRCGIKATSCVLKAAS